MTVSAMTNGEKQNRPLGIDFDNLSSITAIVPCKQKPATRPVYFFLAGETGLEPATNGFGDRYSTN